MEKEIDIVFHTDRIAEQARAEAAMLASTKDTYTARPTLITDDNMEKVRKLAIEGVIEEASRLLGYATHLDLENAETSGLITMRLKVPDRLGTPVINLMRIGMESAATAFLLKWLYSGDEFARNEEKAMSVAFATRMNQAIAPLALL